MKNFMNNKIFFISLGCDKNRIDSEIMLNLLIEGGFEIVDDAGQADCAIVNTCGFIEIAKQEAIENIFDMVRVKEDENLPLKSIVVVGCVAERYKEEVMANIPEVDAVIGLTKNKDIVEVVKKALEGEKYESFELSKLFDIEGKRKLTTPKHFAYLKIAEGCDNHCTYCAIPSIRGGYRSRKMQNILDEAKELVAGGVRELILVAQDTTAFGKDLSEKTNLSMLLKQLCLIDGLEWIRILYAYPDNLDDELLQTMKQNKKIVRYLDLPLQHCSGSVLKRMGRFGDKDILLSLIEKTRDYMPDITLRTTFIVGFPGETNEDFDELLEFADTVKFDRAGCFAFSEEEGTAATKLLPKIEESEKKRRADIFMSKQTEIMFSKLASRIGKNEIVICDGYDHQTGHYICRASSDVPEVDTVVLVKSEKRLENGEFVEVQITKTELYDVYGEAKG